MKLLTSFIDLDGNVYTRLVCQNLLSKVVTVCHLVHDVGVEVVHVDVVDLGQFQVFVKQVAADCSLSCFLQVLKGFLKVFN